MIAPPESPKSEGAAAVIRGVVQAIPVAGGLLSELGNLLNPLEKRKQRWMQEVSTAIDELRTKFNVLPDMLAADERFLSFLLHATSIAVKTHQGEKINALRRALVSTAHTNTTSEDVAFQFLRYIDELTATHLIVLSCLNKHAGQFSRLQKMEQVLVALEKFLGHKLERGAFRAFLHDLEQRFLIITGDLDDLPEYESMKANHLVESGASRPLQLTPLGRHFLEFTSESAP
jgi:hypothetical protein